MFWLGMVLLIPSAAFILFGLILGVLDGDPEVLFYLLLIAMGVGGFLVAFGSTGVAQ